MANRMLTKWDEYLIHQTADPIAMMAGEEAEWCDWLWLQAAPRDAGPNVQAGFTVFPNRGTASGFALITAGDRQYNFRGCRQLSADRAETTIGPLHFEVVEPHRRWRALLQKNPYVPATFEMHFEATEPPYLCKRMEAPPDKGSSMQQSWGHYIQGGTYRGQLQLDNDRFSMDGWLGMRDRSWGLRSTSMGIGLWVWMKAHLPGAQLFVAYQEDITGQPVLLDGVAYTEADRSACKVKRVSVELDLLPITRELATARLSVEDEVGRRWPLDVKPLGKGAYMRGAWGEKPWHEAEPFVSGDVWVLDDEQMRVLGKWLREKHVQYDFEGQTGYGLFEYGVSGRHPVYGPMVRGA